MQPEQPSVPPSGSNYDFIFNPEQPTKGRFKLPGLGNSFAMTLLAIVGGALVIIVVLTLVVNIFFGSKTNLTDIVTLTQIEQEIVRVAAQGEKAANQTVKNAGVNTELSIKTHQVEWQRYLSTRGRVVGTEELALKKDASLDQKLRSAQQTSTFDTAYTSIMRSQLESYSRTLKQAYDTSGNQAQRQLLSEHFSEVQLLLQQWPAADLGLAYF